MKQTAPDNDTEAKPVASKTLVMGRPANDPVAREREIQTMTEAVINAAKALLAGRVPDGALGPDVQFALRGYRAGMVDRRDLLESVARTYRRLGNGAIQFDGRGNIRKV